MMSVGVAWWQTLQIIAIEILGTPGILDIKSKQVAVMTRSFYTTGTKFSGHK